MHTDRRHLRSVSRREHIASIAVATALAVAGALFVLTAARPHFESADGHARHAAPVVEQLTYVAPSAHGDQFVLARPRRAPAEPSPIPRARAEDEARASRAAASAASAPDTSPRTAASDRAPHSSLTAGAPVAALRAGISRPSTGPLRFDSSLQAWRADLAAGLASRRIKPPPLTQRERDEQARAAAFANAAARGTGSGLPPVQMAGGGGVSVPLPFGGPSRKQRERERIQYAEAKKILARIQRKADSLIAVRRRRQADSLAQVGDTSKTRVPVLYP